MKILSLFKKLESNTESDLTPRGISKSIYPENHGSIEHYNQAWNHIYSQTRNLKLVKKL